MARITLAHASAAIFAIVCVPDSAAAQLPIAAPSIVLPFANASGRNGSAAASVARDALASRLYTWAQWSVELPDKVDRAVAARKLRPPIAPSEMFALAGDLDSTVVVAGEIAFVRQARGRSAIGLKVYVYDTPSKDPVSGAASIGYGATISDAATDAAERASESIRAHPPIRGLLLFTGSGDPTKPVWNRGARDGAYVGARLQVLRNGQPVALLRVTDVYATNSEAVVEELGNGIRPGDEAQVIFQMPPIPAICWDQDAAGAEWSRNDLKPGPPFDPSPNDWWAVMPVINHSCRREGGLERAASDLIADRVLQFAHIVYRPLPDRGYEATSTKEQLAEVAGGFVRVMITGEIPFTMHAHGRYAVGVRLNVYDVRSRDLVNGAAEIGYSDRTAREAAEVAVHRAWLRICRYKPVVGIILNSVGHSADLSVLTNRGSRDGVFKGALMRVWRDDQPMALVRATEVFPTDSELAVVDSGTGIRPMDQTRMIFRMPAFPPIDPAFKSCVTSGPRGWPDVWD